MAAAVLAVPDASVHLPGISAHHSHGLQVFMPRDQRPANSTAAGMVGDMQASRGGGQQQLAYLSGPGAEPLSFVVLPHVSQFTSMFAAPTHAQILQPGMMQGLGDAAGTPFRLSHSPSAPDMQAGSNHPSFKAQHAAASATLRDDSAANTVLSQNVLSIFRSLNAGTAAGEIHRLQLQQPPAGQSALHKHFSLSSLSSLAGQPGLFSTAFNATALPGGARLSFPSLPDDARAAVKDASAPAAAQPDSPSVCRPTPSPFSPLTGPLTAGASTLFSGAGAPAAGGLLPGFDGGAEGGSGVARASSAHSDTSSAASGPLQRSSRSTLAGETSVLRSPHGLRGATLSGSLLASSSDPGGRDAEAPSPSRSRSFPDSLLYPLIDNMQRGQRPGGVGGGWGRELPPLGLDVRDASAGGGEGGGTPTGTPRGAQSPLDESGHRSRGDGGGNPNGGTAFQRFLEALEHDGVLRRSLQTIEGAEIVVGWTVTEGRMDDWRRRRQEWFMEGKKGKTFKPNSMYQVLRRLGFFPTEKTRRASHGYDFETCATYVLDRSKRYMQAPNPRADASSPRSTSSELDSEVGRKRPPQEQASGKVKRGRPGP